MRRAMLVLLIAACGDNDVAVRDSGPPQDGGGCVPVSGTKITMRQIAQIQLAAMVVVSPPGDPRLFVVDQTGRIEIIDNGMLGATPFLDLTEDRGGPVVCCGERGLLGLAFHPDYAHNGTFFVFYTTADANVLARYRVDPGNPSVADAASGVVLLSIPDFAENHNGGMLEFGRDGYLYLGTGDGGGGGDPHLNGQNRHALLGKMLRLDVDHPAAGLPYGIPPTNPFADGVAGAPEVYAIGTRNPWRWSFDKLTGDLWIGDVGQDQIEELDVLPAGTPPGANLGWSEYEGDSCYHPPCDPAGIVMPKFEKTHAEGWCAIIAGEVYRGDCYPDLRGTFFFTDYCKHELEAARLGFGGDLVVTSPDTSLAELMVPVQDHVFPVTPASLHAAGNGELYLTTQTCCGSSLTSGVYHLEAGP